jgi:hypothetical protein
MAHSAPQWFKSSYSGGSGTECVECARVDGDVLVRDSKREHGPVLTIQAPAWRSFTRALSMTVRTREAASVAVTTVPQSP